MRIGRILVEGHETYCTFEDGDICREILGSPFEKIVTTSNTWLLSDVKVLAPVEPTKICALARNYPARAKGEILPPMIFFKPPTSVIGPDEAIVMPSIAHKVEFEGELAIVIGRKCKAVPASDWKDVVFGYTITNDVSARDLQQSDGQWARAKGADTFSPIGPWIVREDPSFVPEAAAIRAHHTHAGTTSVIQEGNAADMIYDLGKIIEYVSATITLMPGDVIATGAPAGAASLADGDHITIEIDGIGRLGNPVVEG
ncbi:fumarylacetoacetate hydrolase family protein [Corynebacterium sp. H130]|uniref:fumarylacetoacetate hydrolase family protein n=1 Tax=Corynebacterium sp. H130 TaxID=3133444 RepID=UPI0030A8E564